MLIFDCFSCSVFEIESVNPKNKQKLMGPLPSVANTGALTRKEDMTNIEELKKAKEILDNNPVLEYSPGDLRRMGKTVEDYLSRWPQADQEKYRDYYEEEL